MPLLRFTSHLLLMSFFVIIPTFTSAQRQMERLDRGVVAIHEGAGRVSVSWRMLGTDPEGVAFNLYRVTGDDEPVRVNDQPIARVTHFVETNVEVDATVAYFVRPILDGEEQAPSPRFTLDPTKPFLSIPLQTPEGYTPNDGSVGDLDGDGAYEIVVHQTKNPKDNSHDGVTGTPILQGYELDGALLWEIDLGRNMRDGAHYTPFLVYDFDGDGRAEIVCRTADGATDGQGRVIGDPDADYRNNKGRVLAGPEFLTVFDGPTGAARDTVDSIPRRHPETHSPSNEQIERVWGDDYGNRMNRFLAAPAYLDGERPSIVMCRGYYTRGVLAAWDFREGKLSHRWTFDSDDGSPGHRAYRGQGNHNLSVHDVDGDGRDEIIYGSATIDDNGAGLYSTGLGHGDALHVSDLDPQRPGLEVFMPHEDMNSSDGRGTTFRDAATGELLWSTPGRGDVGRGMAADIDPRHPGYELWASNNGNLYNAQGKVIGRRPRSMNFGIWWDGDLLRELLDHRGARGAWHGVVSKWNWNDQEQEVLWEDPETRSNNGTKGNPVLSGDILGDWREEMIWRSADNQSLRLYVSTHETEHRFRTLAHDPAYRLSIAWQNVGYNQPPHPGFYLGHDITEAPRPDIVTPEKSEAR